MCVSLLAGAGPVSTVNAEAVAGEGSTTSTIISTSPATVTEYEEITTVTADVYYGDFVWGQWVFDWNEGISKRLSGGKLKAGDTDAPLTTGQVYTHGDLIMIGLEEEATFKKIELTSAAAGQIPYKFRLEYSASALTSPPDIPKPVNTIGEYTGYSTTGNTLTVELGEPVTARTLWLQALTNGADQEPGASEWSVSGIHFYKENFNIVPNIPVN
jgi:hypothetical protein